MIFYGKRAVRTDGSTLIETLRKRLHAVAAMPSGIGRHAALVSALLTAGAVAQGVADARFEELGEDDAEGPHHDLLAFATRIARALIQSWDSGFAVIPLLPDLVPPPAMPENVPVRPAEGFAYYALYPEAYVIAARRLVLEGPASVIGIRSIGATLAPVVAAALGSPPPLTVRPVGDPFERRLDISPETLRRLIDRRAQYVVVDEGPGLSGSSFAAAAQLLIDNGVPRRRIAFLPSHPAGPGPRGRPAARALWRSIGNVPATPATMRLRQRLSGWVEAHVGRLTAPLEDLSGGAWRRHVYADPGEWPAVDPKHERLKYLARGADGRWLVKFAGLGEEGERKLARARLLAGHGLIPEPHALVHGFLVQRWFEGRPFAASDPAPIAGLASYLVRRTALLPPPERQGASIEELAEMARVNVREGIGTSAAARLTSGFPRLGALAKRVVPVAVDGKLDRCEWLKGWDGRLCKADALDHDAGHDLIGPQDIAWDFAGAIVEWDLGHGGARELLKQARRLGMRPVDEDLLAFCLRCYAAFRFGAAALAGEAHAEERERRLVRDRMAALARLLERTSPLQGTDDTLASYG